MRGRAPQCARGPLGGSRDVVRNNLSAGQHLHYVALTPMIACCAAAILSILIGTTRVTRPGLLVETTVHRSSRNFSGGV